MSNVTAFEALRDFCVQARHAAGLKQTDVARRSGVPLGTISNFEAAVRPSLPRQSTLEKLARGYGVPYDALDRLSRGLPAVPELSTAALANLLADCSPRMQTLLMEAATWPEDRRSAFEAGLVGLVEALRQSARQ